MITPKTGLDYSALQQNNPYRNYRYTQSAWDKFGNWINNTLGSQIFKTKEMSVADEMANKANAYDAQIAEVQREEMFNSPEEQAARMREAGINPDLQNSGITGGQASPFDNQATSEMPTAEQLQSINDDAGSFVSWMISLVPTVLGVVNSGVDLSTKLINRDNALNELFQNTNNAAKDFISQYVTSSEQLKDLKSMSDLELISLISKDPSLVSQYPLARMRNRVAKSIVRQLRSMDIESSTFDAQGRLYSSRNNPMNYEEETAKIISEMSVDYNQARLKSLTRQMDADYLEANMKALKIEAINSLIEEFRSLYEETNVRSYAYSVLMANELLSGEIDSVLKTLGSSKALEAAIAAKGVIESGEAQDSISDLTDTISDNPTLSAALDSTGAGTAIDNDGNIVVTDYPEGVEPDSSQGKLYRRLKVFNRARHEFRNVFRNSRKKREQKRNNVHDARLGKKNLSELIRENVGYRKNIPIFAKPRDR